MKQLLINSLLPAAGKSRSEYCILLVFAFIGIIGSTYMIQNCNKPKPSQFSNALFTANDNLDMKFSEKQNVLLEINGDLKEKTPIQFSLIEKGGSENYLIDFGNGDKRFFSNDNFVYSYSTPGNYRIQLVSLEKDRMKIIESRNLLISQNNTYN